MTNDLSPFFEACENTPVKEQLRRIFEAVGCKTYVDFAERFGVRQSAVSDARRRGHIPFDWLVKLIRTYGLNPDWIVLGTGSQFLSPSDTHGSTTFSCDSFPLTHTTDRVTLLKILQCLPDEDLENELYRRRNFERKDVEEVRERTK